MSRTLEWLIRMQSTIIIIDKTMIYETINNNKVCDVYKFTFKDANTMNCYCYKDGKTVTLSR